MSCFFSVFGKKRAGAPVKKNGPESTQQSTESRGSSSSSASQTTAAVGATNTVTGGSWTVLQDHEGRPCWWNSCTGDRVYHTPIAPTFTYLLTTPPVGPNGQMLPTLGYPSHVVATPGLYPAVHQPWFASPSPASAVVVPLVYLPNLAAPKKMGVGGGKSGEEGEMAKREDVEKPDIRKKTSGAVYYVWEKFYDEDGRVVWINKVTGKRTLVDPYK